VSVLVTGGNGFIGSALCEKLCRNGMLAKGIVRSLDSKFDKKKYVAMGNLSPETNWGVALKGISHVVHLAAKAHVAKYSDSEFLSEIRRLNVETTLHLARQAACAGVKRFVFISSIKVNGEFTKAGQLFTADDAPNPKDPYGISKYEAEQALFELSSKTGMELVVIRPPLVYGPGVKANFELMMRWLVSGMPLPLAAVTENRRSLVALDNLIDLIVTCLYHPSAANQTFLVSDGEDLSTAALLKRIANAMRCRARLFYIPDSLLKFGLIALNKPEIYQRLCGSLQLDSTKTQQHLNWAPPISVDEGLWRTAGPFRR